MTERLYYSDAYTTEFTATIIDRLELHDQTAIILDKTFFYPTSGGQPADKGQINSIPVVDVLVREEDGAVLHLFDGFPFDDINGTSEVKVSAEIDRERRFDHMQQHSGQHILSQSFIRTAGAETVSFHLSPDSVTIDLDVESLSQEQVRIAESLANEVIWQNRPIRIHLVDLDEAQKMAVRKLPPVKNGKIRLIEIEDFDLNACGGTHVSASGQLGVIKVLRLEKRRGQVRVEFCCGRRALEDYAAKNAIVSELAAGLTTGQTELVAQVAKLQDELKSARKTIKKQRASLFGLEAEQLIAGGRKLGDVILVAQAYTDLDGSEIRSLANQLVKHNGVVALLGAAGERTQLVFSKSPEAAGDMNQLLKTALPLLGSAGGGGSAVMAQGGGPSTDEEQVRTAIDAAEKLLLSQL